VESKRGKLQVTRWAANPLRPSDSSIDNVHSKGGVHFMGPPDSAAMLRDGILGAVFRYISWMQTVLTAIMQMARAPRPGHDSRRMTPLAALTFESSKIVN
jgi:hypothetical protein